MAPHRRHPQPTEAPHRPPRRLSAPQSHQATSSQPQQPRTAAGSHHRPQQLRNSHREDGPPTRLRPIPEGHGTYQARMLEVSGSARGDLSVCAARSGRPGGTVLGGVREAIVGHQTGRGVRGSIRQLLAACAVVVAPFLVCCASLSAQTIGTITFTNAPLSGQAIAGGSYQVAAVSSVGLPVDLSATGACSLRKPPSKATSSKRAMLREEPPEMRRSPQLVYLVGAGQCSVEATAESGGQHIGVVHDFGVAADPSDHVRFVSSPPRHATLRGSYNPSVRSTVSVAVSFSSATPSVCDFAGNEPLRYFLAGTCVIDIRQSGSSKGEASEARQSFTVHGPESTKTQLGTLTIQIYHVRPTLPVGPPGAHPGDRLQNQSCGWETRPSGWSELVVSTPSAKFRLKTARSSCSSSPGNIRSWAPRPKGCFPQPKPSRSRRQSSL